MLIGKGCNIVGTKVKASEVGNPIMNPPQKLAWKPEPELCPNSHKTNEGHLAIVYHSV